MKFSVNFKLELLKSLTLADFPSGSSINYHDGNLYLIGDDAQHILLLDKNYQRVKTIHLFDSRHKRIPKSEKTDLETSTLVTLKGEDCLVLFGSASREQRMEIILISLEKEASMKVFQSNVFINRLHVLGLSDINIESSALVGNHFLLGSRGHLALPVNHIVVTERDFWQQQQDVKIAVTALEISSKGENFLGVSEFCYLESKDLLLLTITSEMSSNPYDDGLIGNSYFGWIENISTKITSRNFKLDGKIKLTDVDKEFNQEKIEGLCVEYVSGNELLVHLISDNDMGQTKLFKVRVEII